MRDFRKLQVWEKAHQLALAVYELTADFPEPERYGLVSQLRRASVSIPANVAQGCGRETQTEFARSLDIAMGSASEAEYLLLLSSDLALVADTTCGETNDQVAEVKRMIAGLLARLRPKSH